MTQYLGIEIDYERDKLIPEQGLVMLTKKGFYKRDWENSPQEGFARAATCYCFGDYDLAQRIYDYVSKGWFTFASPVLSNAIDIKWPVGLPFDIASDWLEENKSDEVDGMPISCFEAGTPVMTINGECSIENIVKGDLVLTHKGRFRKVLATKSSKSSDIYTLRSSGNSTPMNVTGNHRMLTNLGWVNVDQLDTRVHLLASTRAVDFETLDNIVLKPSNDLSSKYNSGTYTRTPINEEVVLTEELAWALGFWFAEGSTSDNGTIRVTNTDINYIERWNSAMKVFGVDAKVDSPKNRNWINGQIHSKNLQEYFDSYFGKGCYTKCIPEDMMKMNGVMFKSFFEGLYAGDGFKTTKHKAVELANTKLISQLSLLLNKNGIKHRLQLRKKRVCGIEFNGIITIPDETDPSPVSKSKGIDMIDGLTYYAIKELTKLDERESTVYDIQVQEDESFSVGGVIAHNCFLNYIDDTKESLVKNSTETRWLSMNGGGVGTFYGQRSPDEKSTGVMAHAKTYDADTVAYRQTSCYLGDTEVLTDSGWVKFNEIKGTEKVVAVDEDGERFLEYPKEWLVSDYSGDMHNFYSEEGLDLHVTANHNMVVTHDSKLSLIRAEEILDLSSVKFTAFSGSKDAELSDLTRSVYEYEGKVYCCTVSTGKIIVRAGNVSLICGNSRRGSMAGYLDITHPEIMSFIDMRNPMAGGDSNTRCMNLNHGVNITDDFMHKMINNEKFELVDPKHGNTGRFLSAREVWNKLMDVRFETGEPYLNFIDTVNRNIPKWIMNPLYKVVQSNLCSEIALMTSAKRSAVCCLSSVNLEKYDEWKDSNMVGDLIRLLDNVLEYFIRLAPEELERAIYSARKERALGLGTLGFHAYLQSKGVAFESGGFNSAVQHTHMIYSSIKEKAVEESKRLAKERGEPSDTRGSGMRNSHLLAIAPNASSSSLVNTSPSAEPWAANAFNAGGRAGAFLIKNRYLEKLLDSKGENTPDVWKSIVLKDGSVQHLEFLSDTEKAVYKTSFEIDQTWIIELAAIRQQYLCQAQSINLFMPPGTTAQYMSDIHVQAWIKGVKSLYYLRSDAPVKAIVDRALIKARQVSMAPEVCVACEG